MLSIKVSLSSLPSSPPPFSSSPALFDYAAEFQDIHNIEQDYGKLANRAKRKTLINLEFLPKINAPPTLSSNNNVPLNRYNTVAGNAKEREFALAHNIPAG